MRRAMLGDKARPSPLLVAAPGGPLIGIVVERRRKPHGTTASGSVHIVVTVALVSTEGSSWSSEDMSSMLLTDAERAMAEVRPPLLL